MSSLDYTLEREDDDGIVTRYDLDVEYVVEATDYDCGIWGGVYLDVVTHRNKSFILTDSEAREVLDFVERKLEAMREDALHD